MSWAPLMLLLVNPVLAVGGVGDCPAASDVEWRLAPLLAAQRLVPPGWSAVLSPVGGDVVIKLVEADGTTISEKRLKQRGSCGELAEAAAVVIATWHAALEFEALPSVPPPSSSSSSSSAAPARASPAAVLAAGRDQTGAAWAVQTSGGLFASWDRSSLAPAFKVAIRGAPATAAIGVLGSLSASGPHRQPVLEGTGRWGRIALGAGPGWQAAAGPWLVGAALEARAALLVAAGTGFATNRSSVGLDFGGAVGAFAGPRRGGWVPWLAIETVAWSRAHQLEAMAPAQVTVALSRFELWFGLGFSLGAETPRTAP